MDLSSPRVEIIAELVRRRQRLGLTQKQTGVLMGVNQPSVAQFESGQHDPRLSTIQRYVRALDLTEIALAESEQTE